MFSRNSYLFGGTQINRLLECVHLLLKMENDQQKVFVELRPFQLVLVHGAIEFFLTREGIPEEYISELELASEEILQGIHKAGYAVPLLDIPVHCFIPMMLLLDKLQVIEIDEDPEESEVNNDG